MKSGFKKIVAAVVTLLIISAQCLVPALASSSQTVQFGSNSVSAKKGDIITLPIVISSASAINLGGLSFYISYKTDCLEYVYGSGVSPIGSMNDTFIYDNVSDGKLSFAWTDGNAISLAKNTVLYKPQFKVLDTAAFESNAKLFISEVYTFTASGSIEDITVSSKSTDIVITVASSDGLVDNVKNLINSIGTVSYTNESLDKIITAASAYQALNDKQKQQVTNYNILSQALVEYERLRIEAEQSAVSAEVSQYIANNKYALALTTDTVAVSDEKAVLDAINTFNKLSTDAQYKIYSKSTLLKSLREKIAALKHAAAEAEEAKAEEEKLRKEAMEYAATFKEEKAAFLSMSVDKLIAEHYTGLNDAMDNLNMLCEINPYVDEYLKSERIILTGLLAAVQDIIKNKSDGTVSSQQMDADIFKSNFSYVLSLTPATVTADDAIDIRLAVAMYDMLDPSVQELLADEYAIITELVNKLDDSGDSTEIDFDEIIENEDTEGNSENTNISNVTMATGKVTMRFQNRKMGAVVWVLLLLLALSTVVFTALQVLYHFFYKKRISEEPAIINGGEDAI